MTTMQIICKLYLCKKLSERVFVWEVTDVFGVEVVQGSDICLVHFLLLAVHFI